VAPQAAPQAAPAQAASTQVARDQAVNDLLKRIQAGKSKRTSSTGSETVARNARRSSAANERSDTATIGIGDTGGAAGRVRNQPPPAAQAAPPPAAQAAPPPAAQAAPPPAAQAAPPPAVGIGESIRERLQRFRDGIPSADRVREYVDALTGYESSSAKAAREAAERLRGPGGINPSAEGPPGPSVFSDANPGGLRDYLNAITGRGRYAPDIGDAVGDAVGAPDIAGAAAGGVIPGGTAAASAAGSSDELLDSLKRYAPIGVAGGLTAYGGLRGWGEGQAEVNRSLQQGFNPNTRY
jgi:hypothetical protein